MGFQRLGYGQVLYHLTQPGLASVPGGRKTLHKSKVVIQSRLQLALSCKATAGVTRGPGARLQRYARADSREQLGDLLSQSSEGSGHESEESNPLTQ